MPQLRNRIRKIYQFIILFLIVVITIKITINNFSIKNNVFNFKNTLTPIHNELRNLESNFVYVSNDNIKGPITVNRDLDDGTKINIYSKISYQKSEVVKTTSPRIAVVMYSDNVKVNSFVEHAISELYQYCEIHGYKFIFNNQRYNTERESFYMKIDVLTEALTVGLKKKEYDWLFWVDGDVILANPTIKLETFLPTNKNIHFIAADRNGLNAGVFFLRVHSWSLNFLLRASSYSYYHKKKFLYEEETAMNNILLDDKEDNHYVIVPPKWFNTLPENMERGDFLLHFCYRKKESQKDIMEVRSELEKDPEYVIAKNNEMLRQEVLEYYSLPRKDQHKITLRNS